MFIIQEMLDIYTREDNDYLRLKLALDDLGFPYEIVNYDNDGSLRLMDNDFCPINDNSKLNELLLKPFIPKGSVKLVEDMRIIFLNNHFQLIIIHFLIRFLENTF